MGRQTLLTRLQLVRLHLWLLQWVLCLVAEALAVAGRVLVGLLQGIGLIGRRHRCVEIEHLRGSEAQVLLKETGKMVITLHNKYSSMTIVQYQANFANEVNNSVNRNKHIFDI